MFIAVSPLPFEAESKAYRRTILPSLTKTTLLATATACVLELESHPLMKTNCKNPMYQVKTLKSLSLMAVHE